jgi:hypothetical protein
MAWAHGVGAWRAAAACLGAMCAARGGRAPRPRPRRRRSPQRWPAPARGARHGKPRGWCRVPAPPPPAPRGAPRRAHLAAAAAAALLRRAGHEAAARELVAPGIEATPAEAPAKHGTVTGSRGVAKRRGGWAGGAEEGRSGFRAPHWACATGGRRQRGRRVLRALCDPAGRPSGDAYRPGAEHPASDPALSVSTIHRCAKWGAAERFGWAGAGARGPSGPAIGADWTGGAGAGRRTGPRGGAPRTPGGWRCSRARAPNALPARPPGRPPRSPYAFVRRSGGAVPATGGRATRAAAAAGGALARARRSPRRARRPSAAPPATRPHPPAPHSRRPAAAPPPCSRPR